MFDNIDVFAVQSGSDAFTVFLTNEAHVFTATSESVVTSDLEGGSFEVVFLEEQNNTILVHLVNHIVFLQHHRVLN